MHDWFPRYPGLYRADTYHLSLAEHGAYCLLIDEYMMTRRPLPDNDQALAKIVGASADEWAGMADTVRAFFKAEDGVLHQSRCNAELDDQDKRQSRQSKAGMKAALIRWHGKDKQKQDVNANRIPIASLSQCDSMPQDKTRQDKTKKVVEAAQAQPPPKKTPSRKSQLKEERLPAEWREYASANQPFMDADSEFENFRGYYLSHGKPMANWKMCWQRWVRNYGKFNKTTNGGVSEKTQRTREAVVYGLVEPDPFSQERSQGAGVNGAASMPDVRDVRTVRGTAGDDDFSGSGVQSGAGGIHRRPD